jgi:hypothetical protein
MIITQGMALVNRKQHGGTDEKTALRLQKTDRVPFLFHGKQVL